MTISGLTSKGILTSLWRDDARLQEARFAVRELLCDARGGEKYQQFIADVMRWARGPIASLQFYNGLEQMDILLASYEATDHTLVARLLEKEDVFNALCLYEDDEISMQRRLQLLIRSKSSKAQRIAKNLILLPPCYRPRTASGQDIAMGLI